MIANSGYFVVSAVEDPGGKIEKISTTFILSTGMALGFQPVICCLEMQHKHDHK